VFVKNKAKVVSRVGFSERREFFRGQFWQSAMPRFSGTSQSVNWWSLNIFVDIATPYLLLLY